MVAITALSDGFMLYTIVFARWFPVSSLSRKRDRALAWEKSPVESQPVSGPSSLHFLELLFRKAPRWNCWTQPFSQSHSASLNNKADLNALAPSRSGVLPERTVSKTRLTCASEKSSAYNSS